jgi:tetratricopeptide (TPR) repeat protein
VLVAAGVVVLMLGTRAAVQVPVWRDSLTLNANSVAVAPWSYASANNLGNAYNDLANARVREGRLDEAYQAFLRASEMYRASLRLTPDAPPTSENLAMALVRVSGLEPDPAAVPARLEEAADHLQKVADLPVRWQPFDPLLAGDLYLKAGNAAKAVEHYEGVLRAHPENAEAARRLADARAKLGERRPPGAQ